MLNPTDLSEVSISATCEPKPAGITNSYLNDVNDQDEHRATCVGHGCVNKWCKWRDWTKADDDPNYHTGWCGLVHQESTMGRSSCCCAKIELPQEIERNTRIGLFNDIQVLRQTGRASKSLCGYVAEFMYDLTGQQIRSEGAAAQAIIDTLLAFACDVMAAEHRVNCYSYGCDGCTPEAVERNAIRRAEYEAAQAVREAAFQKRKEARLAAKARKEAKLAAAGLVAITIKSQDFIGPWPLAMRKPRKFQFVVAKE